MIQPSCKGKVAFVARVYGHLEAFHLPYMKLLQGQGYEVHAYASFDHGKAGVEALGVICHDTPFFRGILALGNITVCQELGQSFRSERFQMVHVNTPIAGFLARIAAWLAHVPVVIYTAHGFHFFKGAPLSYWMLYYPAEWLLSRVTDYIITINQEDFARAGRFPVRRRVFYIPGIGVDTNAFSGVRDFSLKALRSELNVQEKDYVITCIAELNKNKNQIQLVKAVAKLVKNGAPVQCFLLGTGSSEIELKTFVQQSGLSGNIHLLGFRRDVPEILALTDVAVLVSRREGLPKALLEAMAAGKAVVATNVRGNRDLIEDGVNGCLVAVNDVEGTAQALAKLHQDGELRLKMGKLNSIWVEHYNLKQVLAAMEEIYAAALADFDK